jgi:hypothetical protein
VNRSKLWGSSIGKLREQSDPNDGFGAFSEQRENHEPEVRLSWRTDSLMARAKDAHNFLLIANSDLYGTPPYMKLMAELDNALEAVIYHGASTARFRECYAAVALQWTETSWPEADTLRRKDEHLITLARVADLLDERDPRELPFVRQMDRFVKLIMDDVPEDRFYSASYVSNQSLLRGPEERLFRSVLNDREKFFRAFERKRLDGYCTNLRNLGLRAGLSRKTVYDLEDELLIELEWFHSF